MGGKRLARRLRLTMTADPPFRGEKGPPLPHDDMQMAPLRKDLFDLQVWKHSNGADPSSWVKDCMQVPGDLGRLNFPRTTLLLLYDRRRGTAVCISSPRLVKRWFVVMAWR
jgi:hypothetical protein